MTVSMAVNDYMQYALVIPFIDALRRQAPTIRVAILPPIIAGLPSRLLYRERYVGVVRQQHPLQRLRPSVHEFCRYDHLLVSPTGGSLQVRPMKP